MIIYLIRHTSVAVPKGTAYGFTDVPVNPSFEAEAASTLEQLASLLRLSQRDPRRTAERIEFRRLGDENLG